MIINFIYLIMNAGLSFCERIPRSQMTTDLSDIQTHAKYLAIMRNCYDRSIYHEIQVTCDIEKNELIMFLPIEETSLIAPGKYQFDVISRNLSNQSQINCLLRGFITVHPIFSLEAYHKSIKETL